MDKHPTQGSEASGVTEPDHDVAENHYELDLDEHAPADIDEVFKDAVAAVDRSKQVDPVIDDTDEIDVKGANDESPDTESDRSRLESETSGLRDRLMRTLADFDNYRKRSEREKQAQRRFANFDLFKDFLGVLDNFERAMESSGSMEDLKLGLEMIIRQQQEILRRHGVKRVEATGKPFDPKVHEAVAREESAEVEVPMVTKEMQSGYVLHDRLLRPAMVFVAMPGSKPEDDSEGATDQSD